MSDLADLRFRDIPDAADFTVRQSIALTKQKPPRRITGATASRQSKAIYALFVKQFVPLIRAAAAQGSSQADR
jgi:hypothetical protein